MFNIQRYSVQDGPGIRSTVFLKGCPLRCLWCSNPESQHRQPEIMFDSSKCTRCGNCVKACPTGATVEAEEDIRIDRSICQGCGACVDKCPGGARELVGNYMTVEEVLNEVSQDTLFYRNSGGGVTLSGGEPLEYPEFSAQFFKRAHRKGFHTALDTCGYASWQAMQRVVEHVDIVLYDIKHTEPLVHKLLTGVSNELILENARLLAANGISLVIRVPVIPGCNDSEENIKSIAQFTREIGISRLDLLPYHRLGMQKYRKLGRDYELNREPLPRERLLALQEIAEGSGLKVSVVGQ
ncbi:MAG: glycyl-radical enzyme activating protein [Thermodesulfobacteriota bacterium]|nr:glycyl-radical enzyme activating protein [Thermodesulfobacteriota bacterium]